MNEAVFTQALGLTAPWEVERVELDEARKRLDLHVAWRAKTGTCPPEFDTSSAKTAIFGLSAKTDLN